MSHSQEDKISLKELPASQNQLDNAHGNSMPDATHRAKEDLTDGGGIFSNGHSLQSTKTKELESKDSENTYLINPRGLSPQSAVRYHKAALIVSVISVIFSIVTGIAAVALSLKGRSESLFAYGLDAILDSLSSVAVVWRFLSNDIFSQSRERKACIVIGFLFLVSAVSLVSKSIHAIVTETHETKDIILYEAFASICAGISIVLATTKVYLGYKLDSRALATDSIITYVGAAMCVAGVAGLELYIEDSHLWYLDSLFGIICGVFLFFFGVRLLYVSYFHKEEDN